MIKVLIVDDSKVVQEFLAHLLSSDPDIKVVGFAGSGLEAVNLVRLKKPDIITMDIHMPGMDGYEATRMIMETIPTPIVIISGSAKTKEVARLFKSIDAGALAVLLRPPGFQQSQFTDSHKELIRTIKLMSKVKVIRLFPRIKEEPKTSRLVQTPEDNLSRVQVIAIGASTGGPLAIQKILSRLPEDLSTPVLIVQHIATGFVEGLKEWLSATSGIKLKIAEESEQIVPGTGYFAPNNFQMGISHARTITLSGQSPENGLIPSVNYLFHSVAKSFGPNALGVLLTGMGTDGAEGLKSIREKGGFTLVQNQDSSVIFGMPGEALRIGAADYALPPEKIAEILAKSGLK
jgi:two-component system chemotaxis response regulator CheB